uniref:Uncharacterized protein n=1 Tax=Cacopsylla melanoneura TaxID=428564 RepID=A0A8D9BJU6_9HEMI
MVFANNCPPVLWQSCQKTPVEFQVLTKLTGRIARTDSLQTTQTSSFFRGDLGDFVRRILFKRYLRRGLMSFYDSFSGSVPCILTTWYSFESSSSRLSTSIVSFHTRFQAFLSFPVGTSKSPK